MCGIVGYIGKNEAANFLLDGLSKLEYRGYDSAGVAVIQKDKIKTKKTVGRIKSLIEATQNGKKLIGEIGIGHTRWATHGAPTEKNAHPHLSEDLKFAVVHNGIIENYSELKTELAEDGINFLSETDTEVIPHLLEKYYTGDFLEALSKTVSRLKGSYALGVICSDYPDTLMAVRSFSPLIIGVSKNENMIASDVTALVSVTKDVVYLEDGEIAVLTPECVKVFSGSLKEKEYNVSRVTWDVSAAEKGGYKHFMLKEIKEQPFAIRQTIESRIKDGEIVFEGLKLNADTLKKFKKIDIVACGSAYHAGMVGKYIFEEMLRIPTFVDVAGEYRYRNPITGSDTLTILISQSGETADSLAALREAKARGSYTLAIVNTAGSSIAKEADDVIYTLAGPEIAVATTKGYTTQLAVLYLIGIWASKLLKSMNELRIKRIFDELSVLPSLIEKIMEKEEAIKNSAKLLGDPASLFFIGRNTDYAVALEASLKLKEISYIHSEAYAASELKHGTISLIEKGITVIALACREELLDKLHSNIKEVKARGASVIACVIEGNEKIGIEADTVLLIPKTDPLLTAVLEVIPFQLYAYYTALFNGCDIDKPRNLAKSVTVE